MSGNSPAECCRWSQTVHLPKRSQQPRPKPWLGKWRAQRARLSPRWWSGGSLQPAGCTEPSKTSRKSHAKVAVSRISFFFSKKQKVSRNSSMNIGQMDVQRGRDESRDSRWKKGRGWKGMKVRRRREGLEPAFKWTDEPLGPPWTTRD